MKREEPISLIRLTLMSIKIRELHIQDLEMEDVLRRLHARPGKMKDDKSAIIGGKLTTAWAARWAEPGLLPPAWRGRACVYKLGMQ